MIMAKINPKIFKAYDIRGKYPAEINEQAVSEISKNINCYFSQLVGRQKAKIIVAHDARLSSPSLYKIIVKNLRPETHNLQLVEVGLATTPMFYFLVKKLNAIGGLMITASHNPKNYNGLKIVDKNALPISGLEIKKMFNL